MILILEMLKLKKKIKLSNILERVEIDSESKEIIEMLDNYHSNPKAHVIGITGPPGVGKSSLINNLIKNIRKNKRSVGIIAIDPSSTESGGALLGDRTRFTFDFKDENVFVRSMATKNHLGGVSELTYPTIAVMRSMFDFLIVETVGVGQSEINIKDLVDTVILCVQPGSGDTIQFMKSGVFEIPDIIVITKSDLDKLPDLTYSELVGSKQYLRKKSSWDTNILLISSHKNKGFDELYTELKKRWSWLKKDKKVVLNRIIQDKEWIKKKITSYFGTRGLEKLNKFLKYKSNPFNTYNLIKKKFNE